MELTEDQKKNILNHILEIIETLSDKNYQRRVWIRGEGPECGSFGDTVCHYNLLTDSIFEDYAEYGVSDLQILKLKKFHEEFKNFAEDNDWAPLFIDTDEWSRITELAKEVLIAFNYKERT